MTPDGEHTRQNLLRGVPLKIWCRSFQPRWSVTCIGGSQSADELGSVTYLVCLKTRSGSLSIRSTCCAPSCPLRCREQTSHTERSGYEQEAASRKAENIARKEANVHLSGQPSPDSGRHASARHA